MAFSIACMLFSFSACSDNDPEEPDLPVLGGSQDGNSARSVKSRNKPKDGQSHRSSDNFSTKGMVSATHILWSCPDGVSFKVQIDKDGTDGTYADNLKNGSITEIGEAKDKDKLYISDPKGSKEEYFTISYTLITKDDNHYMVEDRYFDAGEAIHDTHEKDRLMKEMFGKASGNDSKYADCLFITYTSVAGRASHSPWEYAWGGGPILKIDPEMSTALHNYLKGHIDDRHNHKGGVRLGIVLLDFYNKHGHDDPYHNVEDLINLNYPSNTCVMPYPKTN